MSFFAIKWVNKLLVGVSVGVTLETGKHAIDSLLIFSSVGVSNVIIFSNFTYVLFVNPIGVAIFFVRM